MRRETKRRKKAACHWFIRVKYVCDVYKQLSVCQKKKSNTQIVFSRYMLDNMMLEENVLYFRLFFSQFGPKLKGIKTQAFQKLNQNFSKLKDFLLSKLNFLENLPSLNAPIEFLFNKEVQNWRETQKKLKTQWKSRKYPKTQEIFSSKTQPKVVKTQGFCYFESHEWCPDYI